MNEPFNGEIKPVVDENEAEEFLNSIIDIFEEFLEDKEIEIENPERYDNYGEDTAIIFGSDYEDIKDRLSDMMFAWRVTDRKY